MLSIIDVGKIYIDSKGSKKKGWTSWMVIKLKDTDYEQLEKDFDEKGWCLEEFTAILAETSIKLVKAESWDW